MTSMAGFDVEPERAKQRGHRRAEHRVDRVNDP